MEADKAAVLSAIQATHPWSWDLAKLGHCVMFRVEDAGQIAAYFWMHLNETVPTDLNLHLWVNPTHTGRVDFRDAARLIPALACLMGGQRLVEIYDTPSRARAWHRFISRYHPCTLNGCQVIHDLGYPTPWAAQAALP